VGEKAASTIITASTNADDTKNQNLMAATSFSCLFIGIQLGGRV